MDKKIFVHAIGLMNPSNKTNYTLLHYSCTEYNIFNSQKIFTESYLLYEIARKYTIIGIEESIEIESYFDIDPIVKTYMLKNGIDYVRGGSYSELDLPEYKYNILNNELYNIEIDTINNLNVLDNLLCNYKDDIVLTKEEIIIKLEVNKIKQKEYEILLSNYNKIKYINYENKKLEITQDFIKEIEFLKTHINSFFSSIYNSEEFTDKYTVSLYVTNFINENIHRYNYIVKVLNSLYINFIETKKHQNPEMVNDTDSIILKRYLDIPNVFVIKNPGYQFDRFFQFWYFNSLYTEFTNKSIKNEETFEETYIMIDTFEYMYNVILNKLTEYKFDLSTYNVNSNYNEYDMNINYYSYLLSNQNA